MLWLVGSTLYCSCPPAKSFAEQFFSDTSESMLNLTKSTCVTTRTKSSSFACISSLMVLKVLGQLVTSFPRLITQTTSRFVHVLFQKKRFRTGLEVTLQSSSHIF